MKVDMQALLGETIRRVRKTRKHLKKNKQTRGNAINIMNQTKNEEILRKMWLPVGKARYAPVKARWLAHDHASNLEAGPSLT